MGFSIPGLWKSPGGGNGNPLQYSWLENSMDRGAWRATVHRAAMSQTPLSDLGCGRQSPFLSDMDNILRRHVPNYKAAPSTHPSSPLKMPIPCVLKVSSFSIPKQETTLVQVNGHLATLALNCFLVSWWQPSPLGESCTQQTFKKKKKERTFGFSL